MLRNLFLRLLCCGAIVAAALLMLPALSRPAAEAEKPLGKLSPDLALVPPDTLWFISVREADIVQHPGLKAAKEVPELAPFFSGGEAMLGVAPEGVERITFFVRRVRGNQPLTIVRTLKPYDKDKVRNGLRAGDEVKAHGKTIYATPGRWGSALWLADDRTFVFGRSSDLVPYLAVVGKPARTHPLAEELKEADGKHAVTAGILPQQFLRSAEAELRADRKSGRDSIGYRKDVKDRKEAPPRFDVSDFKEDALDLKTFDEAVDEIRRSPSFEAAVFMAAFRCRRALLTVGLAAKAAQIKIKGRAEFTSEADAKDGEALAEMARLVGREAATLTPARRKDVPLIAAAVEPLRVAMKDAEVKRDGKVVTALAEVKPDVVKLLKAGFTLLAPRPPQPKRDIRKDKK